MILESFPWHALCGKNTIIHMVYCFIFTLFTHPNVVLYPYDLLSFVNSNEAYSDNISISKRTKHTI